jgi:hypothetical protein
MGRNIYCEHTSPFYQKLRLFEFSKNSFLQDEFGKGKYSRRFQQMISILASILGSRYDTDKESNPHLEKW